MLARLLLILALCLGATPAHAMTGADRLLMVMADAVITVPSAPTIGTATGGNGQVTITFTPPANNGGATITSYTVTASSGGYTATGSSSPITIPVANNVAYTFTVTAHNSAGDSLPSAATNSVTPAVPYIGPDLLMHFDGGFTDETGKTISVVGSPTITGPIAFGSGSGHFSGTTNYLSVASSAFLFHGDLTVEGWFSLDGNLPVGQLIEIFNSETSGSSPYMGILVKGVSGSGNVLAWNYGASGCYVLMNVLNISSGVHHFAAVRKGTINTLYLDGVSVGHGTALGSCIVGSATVPNYIGFGNTGVGITIDELRVINGTAAYPVYPNTNITIPTAPFEYHP